MKEGDEEYIVKSEQLMERKGWETNQKIGTGEKENTIIRPTECVMKERNDTQKKKKS